MMPRNHCLAYDNDNQECVNCTNPKKCRTFVARAIMLECKSFYQTFLDVEPHMAKPLENYRCGIYDEEAISDSHLYEYSYVVNGAFAAELALKYLLVMANIDFNTGNKGHDLLYLYKLLFLNKDSIRQDREALVSLLCTRGSQSSETIEINIQAWSDCYNRFRYSICYRTCGYNGFWIVFVHTVCEYVIEKHQQLVEQEGEYY